MNGRLAVDGGEDRVDDARGGVDLVKGGLEVVLVRVRRRPLHWLLVVDPARVHLEGEGVRGCGREEVRVV